METPETLVYNAIVGLVILILATANGLGVQKSVVPLPICAALDIPSALIVFVLSLLDVASTAPPPRLTTAVSDDPAGVSAGSSGRYGWWYISSLTLSSSISNPKSARSLTIRLRKLIRRLTVRTRSGSRHR